MDSEQQIAESRQQWPTSTLLPLARGAIAVAILLVLGGVVVLAKARRSRFG